jgi:hypothetical protein
VTLSADDTDLIAGNDFTLTATANKTTSGTGFAIFIVNETDGDIVFCQNVTICTHKDFKNEPGSRTYHAYIANLQGQNVQAASAPVVVGWNEWTGSVTLTVDDDEVDAGDVVHFTATANPSINGSIYKIHVTRQDGGYSPGDCLESPCLVTDYYDAGTSYNYVATVLRQDGTNVRATSPALKVTWKATTDWNGTAGIRLAGGVSPVGLGVLVTIEAFASPSLDGSDYVLQIVEQSAGGGGESRSCDGTSDRCALAVTSSVETTRFFIAQVVRRDGTGGAKAASSEPATVTWVQNGTKFACNDGWVVKEVTGTATMLVGGTTAVPLKAGQWVCPRDMVETGPNSKVTGEFEERGLFNPRAGPEFGLSAKIEIKANTQLTLDFNAQSTTHTIVHLDTGEATFFVNGIAKSDFRIKTPTSVASVRGTVLTVAVEEGGGKTTVTSYEHTVVVIPDNPDLDEVTLYGGDTVTVGASTQTAVTKIYGTLAHKRRLPAVIREGSN